MEAIKNPEQIARDKIDQMLISRYFSRDPWKHWERKIRKLKNRILWQFTE